MSLPIATEVETVAGTVTVYRAPRNANGHARYVIHFLNVPFRDQKPGELYADYHAERFKFARVLMSGRNFTNKKFGGGVAFTSFNVAEEVRSAFIIASDIARMNNERNAVEAPTAEQGVK